MIELKKIEKKYKNGKNSFLALKNINLTIGDTGLVVILGKSGSGKSTLLNILGGLDVPTNGELIIDNKSTLDFKNNDYDNYRNNYVGFVFQEFNLINEITVNENVEIPLKLKNITNRSSKIDELLSIVNLSNIGHKKCNELSGGQRQRVAIARALVKDPKILLADEPTGALDSVTSREIFELFKKVSKQKLVIIVTHNDDLAYSYADRIIKISDGEIIEDIIRTNEEQVKRIATNVIEVDSSYELTKKDLKNIIENDSYVGVSTDIHDLTLVYDEILDYRKEAKDNFKINDKKEENKTNKFDNSKSSLSYKDAYKMAKENLKNNEKKYRFLTGVFSCFNIILIIAFIFSFLNINTFIAKQTNSKNSLNIIEVSHLVTKTKTSEMQNIENILKNDKFGYVNKYKLTPFYGSNIEDLEFVSPEFNGIIETSNISNLNLQLIAGKDAFNTNYQIIISDYMAYNFSKYGVLLINNNSLELLYPSSNEELIGKEIRIEETNKNYEIIGIYKTNFSKLLKEYNEGKEDVSFVIESNIDFLYSKVIGNIGFYKQYKEDYKGYSFYEENQVFVTKLNVSNEIKSFYFSDTRLSLKKEKIGNIKLYNLEGKEIEVPSILNDNEIILSIENILTIFNEENVSVNELLKRTEVYNYLNSNELKLSLLQNNRHSSTDEEDVEIIKDINVKIVGILDQGNRVFVAQNIYNSLESHLDGYDSIYYLNNDNTYTLSNKMKELSKLENKYIVGNNLFDIDNSEFLSETIDSLSSIFTTFTIIFLVLSFIICLNHMNIIVKNRYKELTLYRTIGAKKVDIYKMFVFESLHMSFKTSVVGVIFSYLLTSLLNSVLVSISLLNISNIKILNFNLFYCLFAFISIFLICLISSYLSVRSLLKKKLIDAFKN